MTLSDQAEEPTHRLRLPALPKFSGADVDKDSDSYTRWIKKLERHAELQKWSEHEKLLQFELLLTEKAEQVYQLLHDRAKASFSEATQALQSRLNPVRREALVSAQLMRCKQRRVSRWRKPCYVPRMAACSSVSVTILMVLPRSTRILCCILAQEMVAKLSLKTPPRTT